MINNLQQRNNVDTNDLQLNKRPSENLIFSSKKLISSTIEKITMTMMMKII